MKAAFLLLTCATTQAQFTLSIVPSRDDGNVIRFPAMVGVSYTMEESSDLRQWRRIDNIIATHTNMGFFKPLTQDHRFYRASVGDTNFIFPHFHETVEQSCYLDVQTALRGTLTAQILVDGRYYTGVSGVQVPDSGVFRLTDGVYNPANWPNDGHYSGVNEWAFTLAIVGAGNKTNQVIVRKKPRVRNPLHTGITVQQWGVFTVSPAIQEDIDDYMQNFFLANLSASWQIALNGSRLNEFIDPSAVPAVKNSKDRDALRDVLFGPLTNSPPAPRPWVDRLHYFGHGTNTSFCGGIRISEVRSNVSCVYPYAYVALDGCQTAQTTDMLGEFTCFWDATTLADCRDKGLDPGFGCGWNSKKAIAYPQGVVFDHHFAFWVDFYGSTGGLTHRDDFGQYMDLTYSEAYTFAKKPMGLGFDNTIQTNEQAEGFVMVGCLDCFFDL